MSKELDDILLWFEGADVDLDEAVTKYRQATKLIEQMQKYLQTAENKIHNISVSKT